MELEKWIEDEEAEADWTTEVEAKSNGMQKRNGMEKQSQMECNELNAEPYSNRVRNQMEKKSQTESRIECGMEEQNGMVRREKQNRME